MKKLRRRLYALKGDVEFVQGKGKRKPPLQKAIETVEDYLARQKKYDDYNHSFSETHYKHLARNIFKAMGRKNMKYRIIHK